MRLGTYLEHWLAKRTLSEAAAASYEWAIESYLMPGLGNERL